VALIVGQLEKATENDPELNGGLISELMDLQAVETAPAIEAAFATENVDESICGDWEYVRYRLGLGPAPAQRNYQPFSFDAPVRTPKSRAEQRAKNRKKMARKSKKKNRKKN
jgi:hypothetical protein